MASPPADLGPFIASLARALAEARFSFMLIGGQAVLVHGRARLTEDVDITLGAGPERLPELLELCRTAALRPLPADVDRFVAETFVLPARHAATGLRVDFIFSTTPYEAQAIAHAGRIMLHGEPVPVATAEDLILHKLFAARPRDLEDADSVVRRAGTSLDWTYLERWAAEFAAIPGREGMPDRLAEMRHRAGA